MTPDGEVGARVVQCDRQVADRMREVPADRATRAPSRLRDRADVERLPGEVLHARQQDRRDARPVAFQPFDDVLGAQQVLAFARRNLQQVPCRVEPVKSHVRSGRVAIRRERLLFDQQRRARAGRPVEAREQQVQVDRQGVHRHHFVRLRADEPGDGRRHALVVARPRTPPAEMSLDAARAPVAQDFLDVVAGEQRLCAERVATQVNQLAAVVVVRQHEAVAPGLQFVAGVHGLRLASIEPHRDCSVTG